jgi:hypothetical protein
MTLGLGLDMFQTKGAYTSLGLGLDSGLWVWDWTCSKLIWSLGLGTECVH